jgi:AraC-like DNA-binding protein
MIDRYLEDCFRQRVVPRASEFAEFLDANRPDVSEIVARVFGMNLTTLFRHKQLRYAARLLIATDLPVDDVGVAAGFGHRSTFFRRFAVAYGTTPSEYRFSNRPNATLRRRMKRL